MPALNAAAFYFSIVFACGFVLGTLRVFALAPTVGETLAVLIELPVILAVSWFACTHIVGRFRVPAAPAPRLVMGGAAFAFLMAAELGLSLAFGRSASEHLDGYRTIANLAGLLGQVAFALFPLIQRQRSNDGA